MKNLLLSTFIIIGFTASAQSIKTTNGYYKPSTNTYVRPYISTMPNNSNRDNFSTNGNTNPYTKASGTRAQDYSPSANSYGGGNTIHKGSRGGQFYYNKNGNKTYVPKRF